MPFHRKSKPSIIKDQVRRLAPKLSYISEADEPVKLAHYPLAVSKLCDRVAQGDPVTLQSGEQFFEPLLLDPYWFRLWRLLQQSPIPTQVLRLGQTQQAIFILNGSVILETQACMDPEVA
ncbi:MAG: hypothetical protein NW237_12450 [Cyanobacteriota bacterium]|nr:hypothetical protein [Cyanobacteriota bacterium]